MTLNAGIIGLGVGQAHAEAYRDHPNCRLAALCDFDAAKLADAQARFPDVPTFTPEADEVLTDPDINVVSIASYDNFHFDQIIKALDGGKHVFVEKPLCLHADEARKIRRKLRQNPSLRMSSNLILRRSPRFLALKALIDAGRLGELFYLDGDYNYGRVHKILDGWRGKIEGYSPICGGGVHVVDLMVWLTGATVVEVQACGSNIATRGSEYRNHDMIVSILRFDTGLTAKVSVNLGCVYPHFHKLSVYGTRGTFENTAETGLLFEKRDCDEPPRRIDAAYPGVHKGGLIPGFVDAILNETEPPASADDIMRGMSVCFAIEQAAREGRPVRVEYS